MGPNGNNQEQHTGPDDTVDNNASSYPGLTNDKARGVAGSGSQDEIPEGMYDADSDDNATMPTRY